MGETLNHNDLPLGWFEMTPEGRSLKLLERAADKVDNKVLDRERLKQVLATVGAPHMRAVPMHVFTQTKAWLALGKPVSEPLDPVALEQEVFDHASRKPQSVLLHPPKTESPFSVEPGYERLAAVFQDAHDQAALGKGKERHANGEPFHEQRMQKVSRTQGNAYGMAFQVQKKMLEGLEMADREACRRELLGALNYLAGIVIYLDDQEAGGDV